MVDEIPQWAKERACELAADSEQSLTWEVRELEDEWGYTHAPILRAFARYIAEHEEPPVDPLLVEAREIAANEVIHGSDFHWRHTEAVNIALAALRRGIEIARKQDGPSS